MIGLAAYIGNKEKTTYDKIHVDGLLPGSHPQSGEKEFETYCIDHVKTHKKNICIYADVGQIGASFIGSLIRIYKACSKNNVSLSLELPAKQKGPYELLKMLKITDIINTTQKEFSISDLF